MFFKIIKETELVISARKIKKIQTEVHVLRHNIAQGLITPIDHSIIFTKKILDEIRDKK